MSLPRYTSSAVAGRNGLVQLSHAARAIDKDPRLVHMWIKRRRTTKFPMPKAHLRYGQKWLDLFDLEEVRDWHSEYVPCKGGAPTGNRNWVPKSQKTTC